MKTELFSFEHHRKRLVGLVDYPSVTKPSAAVVIVHGYGRTAVISSGQRGRTHELRRRFVNAGLACCEWDKPGCGESEGEFDIHQPVSDSADEVAVAVSALAKNPLIDNNRIGLWSISRGGWIAPLAIQADPGIAFWISVSGPDDKENFRYLLETNLRIEGFAETDVVRVLSAWQRGFEIMVSGGSYSEYLAATRTLRENSFLQAIQSTGLPNQQAYERDQRRFLSGESKVDPETGLMVYVPGFFEVLKSIRCPVLAIFGERDTNVDWCKTADLYRRAFTAGGNQDLTIRTFPEANHSMLPSETGAYRELHGQLSRGDYAPVEGYFALMIEWLRRYGFAESKASRTA